MVKPAGAGATVTVTGSGSVVVVVGVGVPVWVAFLAWLRLSMVWPDGHLSPVQSLPRSTRRPCSPDARGPGAATVYCTPIGEWAPEPTVRTAGWAALGVEPLSPGGDGPPSPPLKSRPGTHPTRRLPLPHGHSHHGPPPH